MHFWCSFSVCRDVLVSKRTARFMHALFILLCCFCLLGLSEKLSMFLEVTMMLLSGDACVHFRSSMVVFECR